MKIDRAGRQAKSVFTKSCFFGIIFDGTERLVKASTRAEKRAGKKMSRDMSMPSIKAMMLGATLLPVCTVGVQNEHAADVNNETHLGSF